MDTFLSDLRGGFRALWQSKLVSGMAILSLALAIAGNISVFTLADAMINRPLPFERPEQLVSITDRDPANTFGGFSDSPANFVDLRRRVKSFERLVAYTAGSLALEGDTEPEPVTVLSYSEGFFDVIGWRPALGRLPAPEEEAYGATPTVVLSNAFWRTHFGEDPQAIGESLDLSGERYRVVGVLSAEEEFLSPEFDVFSPLRLDPATDRRSAGGLRYLGRLKDDVTLAAADQEMKALGEALRREHPDDNRGYSLRAIGMRDSVIPEVNRNLMILLQTGLFLVLLIACANVANLLLAQGQRRGREMAVRAALGAARRRMALQVLTESGVLALIASAIGVALGWGVVLWLRSALAASGNFPQWLRPTVGSAVVVYSLGISAFAALCFGSVPALRASRTNLNDLLREAGRTGSGGRRWLAKGLVVVQVVAAMVLLAGAALLVQSIEWLQYSSPGFDTAGIHVVGVQPPTSGYAETGDVMRFFEQARDSVAAQPGITAAAFASSLPRSPFNPTRVYSFPGEVASPDEAERQVIWIAVTPGYFEALGVPLIRGRDFGSQDRADSPPVTIVNEAFAASHWPDRDPVGERVIVDGRERRVVGVAGNVWLELLAANGTRRPAVYVPHAQAGLRAMSLVARSSAAAEGVPAAIRAGLRTIEPRLAVSDVRTFDEYVQQFFGTQGLDVMMNLFGGLSMLLAAIGIYGVVAFSVNSRTREIGLRMALGANPGRILRLIGMEGVRLLALGLVVGAVFVGLAVYAVGAALRTLAPVEPSSMFLPMALLLVVALAASFWPARRAARLEPVRALRIE